jgi:predicted Co/Zn/Cd cation transporter (cation efflux family)
MMRPKSIVQFERIYLVSLLFVLLQHVAAYFLASDLYEQFTGGFGVPEEFGAAFGAIMTIVMVFSVIFTLGIPLLFMWLASRKRQEFAKWVLLAISILTVGNGLLSFAVYFLMPSDLTALPGGGDVENYYLISFALDGVSEAIGVFALIYLFRQDAVAWFRTARPAASADVFR